jgi:hypothetical protein
MAAGGVAGPGGGSLGALRSSAGPAGSRRGITLASAASRAVIRRQPATQSVGRVATGYEPVPASVGTTRGRRVEGGAAVGAGARGRSHQRRAASRSRSPSAGASPGQRRPGGTTGTSRRRYLDPRPLVYSPGSSRQCGAATRERGHDHCSRRARAPPRETDSDLRQPLRHQGGGLQRETCICDPGTGRGRFTFGRLACPLR